MSKRGGGALFAFLAGAAVGALLGILYAPDKGSNTREKLSFRLDKYRKMLEEFLGEIVAGKSDSAGVSETHHQAQPSAPSEAELKAQQLLRDVDDLLAQLRDNKDQE